MGLYGNKKHWEWIHILHQVFLQQSSKYTVLLEYHVLLQGVCGFCGVWQPLVPPEITTLYAQTTRSDAKTYLHIHQPLSFHFKVSTHTRELVFKVDGLIIVLRRTIDLVKSRNNCVVRIRCVCFRDALQFSFQP